MRIGLGTPSFAACVPLSAMCDYCPLVAVEVCTAPGFADAQLRSFKVFPTELLRVPTRLLDRVVEALLNDPRHEPLQRSFAEGLVSAGLLETLPRLVDPTKDRLGDYFYSPFTSIVEWTGYGCVPEDSVPHHIALLLDFLRSCTSDVAAASQPGQASSAEALLAAISFAGFQSQPCHRNPSALQLSEALVKNLAEFMNTGDPIGAIYAVPIIRRRVREHPDLAVELMNTAVDAGIIPGILRVVSAVREGAENPKSPEEEARFKACSEVQVALCNGVLEFLECAHESVIMQALTSGLLAELEACVRGAPAPCSGSSL